MIAAINFYALLVIGGTTAFVIFIGMFIALEIDARREDRRLNKMRREADLKRDQDTGAGDCGLDWTELRQEYERTNGK